MPNAQVHVLDADHFALDMAADEIAPPAGHRQTEGLVQLHRELEAAYCRLVTITTDNISQTNDYRTGVAVPLTQGVSCKKISTSPNTPTLSTIP